eukprot:CAMPEP_0114291610 /NCGR_PEP_ID=MMETSP0059-20121206/8586_1 /TAXON_ID=36894 /ORGANISM="Pyramimonas parkeae, Strain CCMP726" /LENGTH=266 /DNA_ID=CAMNT_0001413135 /DNA_START=175 /DNA_END=975 /DNA_ORIENTATION=-
MAAQAVAHVRVCTPRVQTNSTRDPSTKLSIAMSARQTLAQGWSPAAVLHKGRPLNKTASPTGPVCMAIKKREQRNVVKTLTLVASEGNREKVMEICKDVVAKSTTKMTENKSMGILEFVCQEDTFQPGTFHFWERYQNNVKMAEYNTSEDMVSFGKAVRPLLEAPMGMMLYEFKNGHLGPCSMPIGPEGEGGLDDACGGNSGSGGGATLHQTAKANLGWNRRGDEGDSFGMPAQVTETLKDMDSVVNDAVNSAKKMFDGLLSGGKK